MYKYMNNYVIIHITTNINDKDQEFLYTFNQRSFEPPRKDQYRPYLSHIHAMRTHSFNKKYHVLNLDKSDTDANHVPSKNDVKNYVDDRLDKEYKVGGYLYVPTVSRAFKIRKKITTGVNKTNNQSILYGNQTSLNKLLLKDILEKEVDVSDEIYQKDFFILSFS